MSNNKIRISLNPKQPDVMEVKRYFINTVERINQHGLRINHIHADKLSFIARQFNEGKIKLTIVKDALDFVFKEAILLAGR